ncbi:MAG TPA: hypothetical protein VGB08_02475 [Allosphingosinicella sp.]|jgi:hypothetical protein
MIFPAREPRPRGSADAVVTASGDSAGVYIDEDEFFAGSGTGTSNAYLTSGRF